MVDHSLQCRKTLRRPRSMRLGRLYNRVSQRLVTQVKTCSRCLTRQVAASAGVAAVVTQLGIVSANGLPDAQGKDGKRGSRVPHLQRFAQERVRALGTASRELA